MAFPSPAKKCFPVNIAKILRTPILKNLFKRLFLRKIHSGCICSKQKPVLGNSPSLRLVQEKNIPEKVPFIATTN